MNKNVNYLRLIINKYILTLVAFIVFMLFIDHNDLFVQMDRQQQLDTLLQNKAYYESEIEKTRQNLTDLQSNPAALEKIAREKYLWKQDNEDIFIINQKNNTSQQ